MTYENIYREDTVWKSCFKNNRRPHHVVEITHVDVDRNTQEIDYSV